VAEFAYFTGWRRGEIFGLQWRQVDFRNRILRLEAGTTKNDEARTFPFAMFPRLERLLEEQRNATKQLERERGELIPLVFHLDGRPMRGWYYDAWKAACKRAGLPGKLMHDFRRTVVRNLERAGVPRSVAR
jgi:integrase